jgi:hypothetical protein
MKKIDVVLRHTALLLVFSTFSQSMAFAKKPLDGPAIREKVAAIGEGQQCRLKLVDGTQVKGMIVSIHADNLTLKTKGVEEPRRIDYAQITAVQKSGISELAKLGMVVGVICALLLWLANEMGT